MVHGSNKSGARKKRFVRTVSGVKTRYDEKPPGKAHCISGRTLPGTASGTKNQIHKLSKTQRRPSRPYGGVLSSPVMRAVLREQAQMYDSVEDVNVGELFAVGRVCMKLAGRDAGSLCLVVDQQDGKLLIDGQTRRRAVNPAHLQPLASIAKIKKGADSKAVKEALATLQIEVVDHVPQRERIKAATKKSKK